MLRPLTSLYRFQDAHRITRPAADHERHSHASTEHCERAFLAYARRGGHRARELVFRLGTRSGDGDLAGFSREPGRARRCARNYRRCFGRAVELREAGGRVCGGSCSVAEADRDHWLLRDGGDDVRLCVRAQLAGGAAAARIWMDGARQPGTFARRAAGRLRAAGAAGARVRIRARDGHARRRAGAALRDAADRRAGNARRAAVDAAARAGGGRVIRRVRTRARRERGTAPRRFRRSDRGSRGCLAATGISWLAYSRTASAISRRRC